MTCAMVVSLLKEYAGIESKRSRKRLVGWGDTILDGPLLVGTTIEVSLLPILDDAEHVMTTTNSPKDEETYLKKDLSNAQGDILLRN